MKDLQVEELKSEVQNHNQASNAPYQVPSTSMSLLKKLKKRRRKKSANVTKNVKKASSRPTE